MFHQGVDPPSLVQYPRLSYRHRRQAIKCRMCRAAQPQWVTFNDDLATCSPCHFCEDCFTQFHYSKEGKKIGNFEAYPFHPTSHWTDSALCVVFFDSLFYSLLLMHTAMLFLVQFLVNSYQWCKFYVHNKKIKDIECRIDVPYHTVNG